MTGGRPTAVQAAQAAGFAPDDHDALVRAAFACGTCLHRPEAVHLREDGGATCRCGHCAELTHVHLDPDQRVRIALDPSLILGLGVTFA